MANNTETVAVKTEFVNIITKGELLSSPISATFSTIITKASLIEVPLAEGPINKKTITTLYDEVFVDAMSYRAFTENKLRPWENALEYNHFETLPTSPGTTRRSRHTHQKGLHVTTRNWDPCIQDYQDRTMQKTA